MARLLPITAKTRPTGAKTPTQLQRASPRARLASLLMEAQTKTQMGLNIENGLWNVGFDVRFPWTIYSSYTLLCRSSIRVFLDPSNFVFDYCSNQLPAEPSRKYTVRHSFSSLSDPLTNSVICRNFLNGHYSARSSTLLGHHLIITYVPNGRR